MALRTGTSDRSCSPVLGCIFPMAIRHGISPWVQRLPGGASPQRCQSLHHGAPTSIFPMTLRHGAPGQQQLRHSAPPGNKPHPAERSTPVWLAIWHIWAGFANSQQRCATFHSTYSYKCTSSLLPTCNRCSDIANLLAHLHRLPTPPPHLRRMMLPPGRWRRSLVQDEAVAWPGYRSWMLDMAVAWPVAAFLQITARANPCSRHLWGTLARAVASI